MWALDAAGQAEGRFVPPYGVGCERSPRLAAAPSQEKRHAKYRATDHCPRQLRARHPIGCREGTRKRAILCACCIVGTDDAARPCRRRRVTRRKCLGERFVDQPFVMIRRARVGRRRIRLGRVSARISLENHVDLPCVFRWTVRIPMGTRTPMLQRVVAAGITPIILHEQRALIVCFARDRIAAMSNRTAASTGKARPRGNAR
jgi:hypothetical protein